MRISNIFYMVIWHVIVVSLHASATSDIVTATFICFLTCMTPLWIEYMNKFMWINILYNMKK